MHGVLLFDQWDFHGMKLRPVETVPERIYSRDREVNVKKSERSDRQRYLAMQEACCS